VFHPLVDLDSRRLLGHERPDQAGTRAYERDAGRFYALVLLACSVICFHALVEPT